MMQYSSVPLLNCPERSSAEHRQLQEKGGVEHDLCQVLAEPGGAGPPFSCFCSLGSVTLLPHFLYPFPDTLRCLLLVLQPWPL